MAKAERKYIFADLFLAFILGIAIMSVLASYTYESNATCDKTYKIETRHFCLNADCSVIQRFKVTCYGCNIDSIEPVGLPIVFVDLVENDEIDEKVCA